MKFSVIIPVYNAANTIERCISSIVNNTFKDVEIIVIDDCSQDDSLNICRKIAAQNNNLHILHNECNRGVSYTRNRGLESAQGEYILFVDSDDWIEPTYLQSFEQALEENKEFFAICGFVNHDEKHNGRTDNYCWDSFQGTKVFLLSEELQNLYNKTLIQQLWNKVFVNSIIKKNNLKFDESISIGEDFRFILLYLKAANFNKVIFINKLLYHYMRDQETSLMFHVGYESVEEPLKNLYIFYELQGIDQQSIQHRIAEDRNMQLESYAYLIFHNVGMKLSEKRRLIMALDNYRGRELYRKNFIIYQKEKISFFLKKLLERKG